MSEFENSPFSGKQTWNLLVIIVLYKQCPRESSSLQTLLKASERVSADLRMQVILWDNTPERLEECELPACVRYIASPHNPGLAEAYNNALEIAHREGYDWLLTLDQDTTLPVHFLVEIQKVVKNIGSCSEVAAILPHVRGDGKAISPFRFVFDAVPQWYSTKFGGISRSITFAVNSAATLRVPFLRGIGGYNPLFPLDSSDLEMFARFHVNGGRAFIVSNLVVLHNFSLLDKSQRMSLQRYKAQLLDECGLWDQNMGGLARWERIFRLAGRACQDILRTETRAFFRITIAELGRRLTKSRRTRILEWKALATARARKNTESHTLRQAEGGRN
jgi:GT2 family glycosyltransferase